MPPPRPPIPKPPLFPPQPPRSRYNRKAIYLAVVIAAVCLPFTLKYQRERVGTMKATPPVSSTTFETQGPLPELYNLTDKQVKTRFGEPVETHDYSLNYGTFAGPYNGLKHYYRFNDPDYAKHVEGAETVWAYPQYSTIREMIWRQQDSYLTVWLHEPRAEIDLTSNDGDIALPDTSKGDWVALDNYRVGKGLLKTEPKFR